MVSMPSRAYTSFLQGLLTREGVIPEKMCQCPLGLIPHFYINVKMEDVDTSILSVNALSGLYLISTVEKALTSYTTI